jgi:hypothetical protein
MCNTSKEMGSTRRDSAEVRSLLRGSLCASALLAGLTVADPALARSSYDGAWSVVVMTRGGACQSGMRYGVQIVNGQVVGGEGGASVQGRVAPSGAVSVAVQAGGQWANGSGRLGSTHGGGVWRGQGSAAHGWHSASEAPKLKWRGPEDRSTIMLPAITGPATPRHATIRQRPLVASIEPFCRRTFAIELG